MSQYKNNNSKRGAKKKLLFFASLVVLAAVFVGFALAHHKNAAKPASNSQQLSSGITSKPTPHAAPASGNLQPGGAVDTHGKSGATIPPASEWTSSASGNITLQLPTSNSTVEPGDTITGTAKVSNVQFILKDDSVGQIAQGSLNVVGGRFSGTLGFTPHNTSGELEVYYPNPKNGAEEDLVTINVKFTP